MSQKNYYYFVEGQDDKKIVSTLKTDYRKICAGKVQVFNVVQEKISVMHLRNLKQNTIVILVFDVDTDNVDILKENINFLKRQSIIKEVICVPQVKNLEDEFMRSCNIKQIKELTNSKSNREYKSDLIKITNLKNRLDKCKFDFDKFWIKKPENIFRDIPNESSKIRIKDKM